MSLQHSPRSMLSTVSLLTQLLSPSFFLPRGPYVGWPHYLPHHRSDPWHHPAHFSPAYHSLATYSCLDSLCPVPSPPTHLMHHPTSSQASVSPTPISLHSPRTDPAPPLLTPSHGSLVSSETPNSVAWPQGFLPLNILLPSHECSPCLMNPVYPDGCPEHTLLSWASGPWDRPSGL